MTFYNRFTEKALLEHLESNSGGVEAITVISLQQSMLQWWENDPRLPKYINQLENAQKNVLCTDLPITDTWLATIAFKSLLMAGSFPKECSEWDGKPKAEKSWPKWKEYF